MTHDDANSLEPISGIILAGGFGTRLGVDKASAQVGDPAAPYPLLHWTAAALAAVTDDLVIVARPGQTLPATDPSWRVVEDSRLNSGPLAGIEAGLAAIRHDLALVVATDMPLVRPTLLRAIAAACADGQSPAGPSPGQPVHAAMPIRDGRPEPLLAAYRRACLPVVSAMLDSDERRPRFLLGRVPSRRIDIETLRLYDPDLISFRNVNTPEDLADVGRLLVAAQLADLQRPAQLTPARPTVSAAPNGVRP